MKFLKTLKDLYAKGWQMHDIVEKEYEENLKTIEIKKDMNKYNL